MKTEEIKLCPFRTYTEFRPAILKGDSDVSVMGFMDCLKEKCPAFYSSKGYRPGTGEVIQKEYCRRLEVLVMDGKE